MRASLARQGFKSLTDRRADASRVLGTIQTPCIKVDIHEPAPDGGEWGCEGTQIIRHEEWIEI